MAPAQNLLRMTPISKGVMPRDERLSFGFDAQRKEDQFMPGESSAGVAASASRYRALLDASTAMVEQPTVKAVLHSVRGVLSSICRLHGVHLWVLGSDRE